VITQRSKSKKLMKYLLEREEVKRKKKVESYEKKDGDV